MTPEEHKQRHVDLHQALDELLADYIQHGNGRPREPIFALLSWSASQAAMPAPDHPTHYASPLQTAQIPGRQGEHIDVILPSSDRRQ